MKAIVLAAGEGSRLLPLTLEMPKCLVEVDGRAILDHQLAALAEAGIDEALVVAGYRAGQVAAHVAAHRHPISVALVANPFWQVASSIGSVWAARGVLGEAFAIVNGDTLFDAAIIADARAALGAGVGLVVEALGAPDHDDMLVEVADGRVSHVDKALADARATHRSLGIVLSAGGNAYAEALDATIAGEEGPHAFHHAVVARLAGGEGVAALEIACGARWQEIDRPADIARWHATHAGR